MRDYSVADVVICSLFALSPMLFLISLALVHSQHGTIALIGLSATIFSFVALPGWAVWHVTANKSTTSRIILRAESIAAGLWVSVGVFLWLAEYVRPSLAVAAAAIAAVAIAVTPHLIRSRRQR